MITKLLFVNDNVREYSYFIKNSLPEVEYILLNSKDTLEVVKEKLQSIDLSLITNLGVVFENTTNRAPFIEYTSDELAQITINQTNYENALNERQLCLDNFNNSRINNDTSYDITDDPIEYNECISTEPVLKETTITFLSSGDFFSEGLLSIITSCIHLETIDILSCNIRHHNQFDKLNELNIQIRYSTNITGLNGDWTLESHNVDIAPFYFIENIRNYPYRLGHIVSAPSGPDINGDFIIATADDLYWLMTQTSNTMLPLPNLSSSFIVQNHIDMNNVTGGPIIHPAESIGKNIVDGNFIGKFNGNNKTIIVNTVSSYSGFFGRLGNGAASNVSISNFNLIYSTTVFIDNGQICGGICGFNNKASITGCTVTFNGNANITGSGSNCVIGGICGNCNILSSIINCTLTVNGNTTITSSGGGASRAGGICGQFSGTMSGCNATFNGITDIILITGTNINSGSIVGINSGNISNCILNFNMYTTIKVDGGTDCNSGGVVGLNSSSASLSVCTLFFNNITDIISKNGTAISRSGGMCGINSGILNNCIATFSNITNITSNGIGANKHNGGLVGTNFLTIMNCQLFFNNNVNIKSTGGTDNNTGGICGRNDTTGTITNCIVTCYGNTDIINTGNINNRTGGIVGINRRIIEKCTVIFNNTANINSTSTGVGVNRTGGIFGNNDSGAGIRISGCIVVFSESTTIKGNNVNTGVNNSGGIGGVNQSLLEDCMVVFSNDVDIITQSTGVPPVNNNSGGICANNFTGGTIQRCAAIFVGNSTITSIGATTNNSAGICSLNTSGVIIINCVAVFKDYTILGGALTSYPTVNGGTVTTSYSMAYGVNIIAPGGATVSTPLVNQVNVFSTLNLSPLYTAWLEQFIRIIYINIVATNSANLALAFVNSPNILPIAKESAFCASMSTVLIVSILATFATVTLVLTNQISIPPSTDITFFSNTSPYNINIYGFYYIPITSANLIILGIPVSIKSYPTGISFNNGSIILVGQSIIISSLIIIVIGVGSSLIQIGQFIPVLEQKTCCTANICNANPQTATFDNQQVVTSKSGAELVKAVSNFYEAAATGKLRPNAPPIFSTYQQMMEWKQRQNRR